MRKLYINANSNGLSHFKRITTTMYLTKQELISLGKSTVIDYHIYLQLRRGFAFSKSLISRCNIRTFHRFAFYQYCSIDFMNNILKTVIFSYKRKVIR